MEHVYLTDESVFLHRTLCGKEHLKRNLKGNLCLRCHDLKGQRKTAPYKTDSGKAYAVLKVNSKGTTSRCPFCGNPHYHSREAGHRVAHCWVKDVSFKTADGTILNNKDGYFLKN